MYHEFAQLLGGSHWLMEPRAFRAMVKRADLATPAAIEAAIQAYAERPVGPRMMGDVAVIDACGPITYKRSPFSMYFGGTAIVDLQEQFRAALGDPAVRTIVFRWDSPGGLADMVPEFADEVFQARGQKPIISIADTVIASAAEWIAAQADLTYVSASSQVGSIGVYIQHEDVSEMLEKLGVKITLIQHGEHKTDGHPAKPLGEDVEADWQKRVDEVGDEFDAAMARGRGVTKKVVLDTFGQGQVFRGKRAIAVGLADKLGTFQQVMGKLTKGRTTTGARASALGVAESGLPATELAEAVPGAVTDDPTAAVPASDVEALTAALSNG